jgi:ApaG protein
MSKISRKISNGILIEVIPEYISPENHQDDSRNYFSYTITITNQREDRVQLLSRHWIIINSEGHREDVLGDGVVGYTPKLLPGQSFTYTSYCPIDTEWGTMEGEFKFADENGDFFRVEIPRFYLVVPTLLDTSIQN